MKGWHTRDLQQLRRAVAIIATLAFLYCLYLICKPFLLPAAWAMVIAVSFWPWHMRITRLVRYRFNLAALLSSFSIGGLILMVMIPLSTQLANESRSMVSNLTNFVDSDNFKKLMHNPAVDNWIKPYSDVIEKALREGLRNNQNAIITLIGSAVLVTGKAIISMFLCLFILFFLFRDGKNVGQQAQLVFESLLGPHAREVIKVSLSAIEGTVKGIIATAFAQSLLAGVGFLIFGAPLPILFSGAVFIASFIPLGPPFVYIPLCVALWLGGNAFSAFCLLLWCVCLVSMADNLLRTIFVAQNTRISFLLVFISLVGGVIAFGLIGLFIGPVLVASGQSLWLTMQSNLKHIVE